MSYPIYTQPQPTIEQLKARRLECLTFALAMHRRILRAHPDDGSVIEWEQARRYWIAQAYFAHGEILTRAPKTCLRCDGLLDALESVGNGHVCNDCLSA